MIELTKKRILIKDVTTANTSQEVGNNTFLKKFYTHKKIKKAKDSLSKNLNG